jgi:hypothetical protein
MPSNDLWGEVQAVATRTPVSILREQAALLGPKTEYLVEAQVETEAVGGNFYHRFNLIVPPLDKYTYQLFMVVHDVNLYPISVWGEGKELQDETEFTEWLGQRLSAPKTRKVLSNLIAQARS